jgi:hypothetical protein
MKSLSSIRLLYYVAAAYDGLIGLAFIVAGPRIYDLAGITPPNHWGYVHFAAGTLVIFGWLFLMITLRPVENRNLVIYGVLLKICYVLTVGWHELHGGVPMLWKCFAVADAVFLVLFIWTMSSLRPAPAGASR